MSFVTHIECSATGERYEAGKPHNLSRAGKPLLVRYDLEALAGAVSKEALARREEGFWRYHEFLPVSSPKNRISLGEVTTPLIRLERTEAAFGVTGALFVKDESRLPTASFKARGLGVAVSMAKELRLSHLAIPTNGNAGAAMAAYASAAGIKATVFCPDDTPAANVDEIAMLGGAVFLVNGLINDCGRIVAEGRDRLGWFDVSTLKEPYRIEGKKTMGLELAEQLGWTLPNAIFYPTGGGTGLIGMAKAFDELEAIGWIGRERPKLIAVQAAGCAPIVRAWEEGAESAALWENAQTAAAGIRVPAAIGDFLILREIRRSDGFAVAVEEEEIFSAWREIGREEGVMMCPEGAATYAALRRSLAEGRIGRNDKVVLFNCAAGQKCPMPANPRRIDRHQPIDFEQFR